jgi:hypoxanthine phosphoribosyltransferase
MMKRIWNEDQILKRIEQIAYDMKRDYEGINPLFVIVLEGGRRFADELCWQVEGPGAHPRINIQANRTVKGTDLGVLHYDPIDPSIYTDKHVVIIDDLSDKSVTLAHIGATVAEGKPLSINYAVLVNKLTTGKVPLDLKYVGFETNHDWIVGFGMDLDDEFRELNGIYAVRHCADRKI